MLVSKPTHGGGAPLGIDLEAGVAKIRIARPAPPAEVVDDAAQEPAEAVSEPAASDPRPADSAPAPTDPGSDSH